jgi:hypothetical protein
MIQDLMRPVMDESHNPYRSPEAPLTSTPPPPGVDLVTIGSFRFVTEADTLRLHLAEAGIPAYLMNAQTVNADWFLGNAIGYVKIQVASDQAVAARAIFEETEALWKARRERSQPGELAACLACGAPLTSEESTCAECGWSYDADADEPSGEETASAEDAGDAGEDTEDAASARDDDEEFVSRGEPVDQLNWQVAGPLFLAFGLMILGVVYWIVTHRP